MATLTSSEPVATKAPARLIDGFITDADIAERHETLIHAPADVVFDVAQTFDVQSIPLVRAMFWLRAKLLGAAVPPKHRFSKGVVRTDSPPSRSPISSGRSRPCR